MASNRQSARTRLQTKTTHHGWIWIDVTQEDIDKAEKNVSSSCAVATAIGRCIPDARMPSVDVQAIRFSRLLTDKRYVFLTPPQVQDYIIAFDAGDPIEPFAFVLNKPAYVADRRHVTHTESGNLEYEAPIYAGTDKNHTNTIQAKVRANPPRPSKTYREFGMRRMRINQADGTRIPPVARAPRRTRSHATAH